MKKPMTKQQAIEQLRASRQLTTNLLKPLNISFESFLRLAQMADDDCVRLVEELLELLDPKGRN